MTEQETGAAATQVQAPPPIPPRRPDFTERAANVARLGRARWHRLNHVTQHWLINIAIGIAIELLLHWAGHTLHWQPLVSAQNYALDVVMRANAAVDPVPDFPTGRTPLPLAFIDIDDATWRSSKWAGGEPYRAPRHQLLELVSAAFERGASQVVLDVVVEGAARPQEITEDEAFARGLEALLRQPFFGAGKQLVLVRTLRQPLALNVRMAGAADQLRGLAYPEGYLSEMRESPAIDAVVAMSGGRIALAAPYFTYSSDHILRDWQLLQAVCQRKAGEAQGAVRIIPSVQLVVLARHAGVPANAVPWQTENAGKFGDNPDFTQACLPFPKQTETAPAMSLQEARQRSEAIEKQVDSIIARSWTQLRDALRTTSTGLDLHDHPPHAGSLANRVVFRIADTPKIGQAQVIPAHALLIGESPQNLRDRVVVIGQSYAEAGDRHITPLGEMSGGMVLVNAIDSMARHQMISPPRSWLTFTLAVVLIVFVGYIFARWDSMAGTWISTMVAIMLLTVASFYLFKHGVWLDFALPLLGIQVHRMVKSLEERGEHKRLARSAGSAAHD